LVVAVVDWWSVARDRPALEYLAKPMVIVVLVGVALAIDASDDTARGLIIAALGASLVGDVVLMAPDGLFGGGLAAFLVAHLLYITAFWDHVRTEPALAGAIVVVGLLAVVLPRLLAAVRTRGLPLTVAVCAYVVAVATTAVAAVGTGIAVAAIGGGLLLASDALLGWGRFVGPAPGGRPLVHITYHLGQIAMVLWLAT
jgi:uncharacterized membrane protein YhhN